jgi:hypothetical protein
LRGALLAGAFLAAAGCTEHEPPKTAAVPTPPAASEPSPAPAAPPAETAGTPPAAAEAPPAEPPPAEELAPELAFTGRLLIRFRDRLYELAQGPTGELEQRPVGKLCRGCGRDEAAVSPSGRFLVYSTGQETLLRDLRSGEARQVLPHRSTCLRWSPDGSRFAYVKEHLYVADRAGASTLVYEAPSSVYTLFTYVGSTGEGSKRLYGEVGCPVWLARYSLVFDRFSGSMPQSLGEDTDEFGRSYYDELRPNGTSLATLDPGPTLEHAAKRLDVTAACPGGKHVLLTAGGLLASARRGIAGLEPRRVFPRRYVLASGFLPGTCTPYAVTAIGFKIADPQSGKVTETFDVDAGETGLDEGRRWQGVWVGDPAEMVVVVVDFEPLDVAVGTDFAGCPCSVSLLDLETGETRELASFPGPAKRQVEPPQVIAWVPG